MERPCFVANSQPSLKDALSESKADSRSVLIPFRPLQLHFFEIGRSPLAGHAVIVA
jgi:hypothetical protein